MIFYANAGYDNVIWNIWKFQNFVHGTWHHKRSIYRIQNFCLHLYRLHIEQNPSACDTREIPVMRLRNTLCARWWVKWPNYTMNWRILPVGAAGRSDLTENQSSSRASSSTCLFRFLDVFATNSPNAGGGLWRKRLAAWTNIKTVYTK